MVLGGRWCFCGAGKTVVWYRDEGFLRVFRCYACGTEFLGVKDYKEKMEAFNYVVR